MTQNAKKFIEMVSQDKELENKINNLNPDAQDILDQVAKVAAEHNFDLTAEDFASQEKELDEDELAVVAGGAACSCIGKGVGGSTSGSDLCRMNQEASGVSDMHCSCTVYGSGDYSSYMIGSWGSEDSRCTCFIGGSGDSRVR